MRGGEGSTERSQTPAGSSACSRAPTGSGPATRVCWAPCPQPFRGLCAVVYLHLTVLPSTSVCALALSRLLCHLLGQSPPFPQGVGPVGRQTDSSDSVGDKVLLRDVEAPGRGSA